MSPKFVHSAGKNSCHQVEKILFVVVLIGTGIARGKIFKEKSKISRIFTLAVGPVFQYNEKHTDGSMWFMVQIGVSISIENFQLKN